MSCVTVPTATQFSTFTTDSVSTSFSNSISTLSPATTTIDSVTCVPTSSGNVTTSSCSTSEVVSTVGGGTTTIQVPIQVTIPITSSSATATLFSTSCSDGTTGSPNPPPSNTTTNDQTSTSTVIVTTSIPTQVTFQSSFTSDGNVIVTSGTTTTFVVVTTAVPVSTGTGQVSGGSTDTSAIVGGVVGGVAGAIVLSFVAWFLLRKRRRYDFDDDLFLPQPIHHDEQPKNVLRRPPGEKGPSLDAEPRPYTYGALSSSAGPSSTAHTPSTENAPAFGYSRPYSPPRLPPLQTMQAMPGQVLPNAPGPMQPQPQMPPQSPPQLQPQPPQSTISSPSAYSDTQPSSYSMPMGPPATTATASASGSTITNTSGYDQRRPLQVVNNDYQSGSSSYAPYAAGAVAGMGPGFGPGVPSQQEKAQIYLHPQTGLTAVPERPEASGSNAYFPHAMGSPPAPSGASAPAPAPGPDPPRMPFVHQDGGRVPGTGKASMAAAPAATAPESEAPPPAYSE
ncbi:hypothetical protein C8Q73DRAFT_221032 [Cubamyces lactineus]|nr:hypothetical protein C8Q73DRAFT_221032 [Cubamyces lactineus]